MSETSPSQIFSAYRAIGICCDHVPLVAQCQASGDFVVTAVGKTFHVYLVGDMIWVNELRIDWIAGFFYYDICIEQQIPPPSPILNLSQ